MKIFAENKKAYFDYEILEKFEAGLVLIGQEVKSIRMNRLNLTGSYVVVDKNSEAYLVGANIPPYQPKNMPGNYDLQRSRKLLLRKKEIQYLIGKSRQSGLTLIPLRVYTNDGKIKLEFGIAKGKKQFDKREKIEKRELDRAIQRELKRG
ncbi:MAG: SsrA-binding protein SmpB [Candidatus Nealsonbacteria bacterium]|nr:SsrA-binding protein SmpB [Candidatus Nealsonbacteria bacterium]